jgi:hypothetical protein
MKKPVLIVQISDQHLKMAVARPAGPRFEVKESFAERIDTLSDEEITQRIRLFLKEQKSPPSSAIISLVRNSVTVRNLHLPSQDPAEIAQMVDLHILRIMPYKKEDIISGFRTLGLDERGYTRVILAIVKIAIVRRLVGIVEQGGLSISRIVLGSYGTWHRIAVQAQEPGPGALVLALDVDCCFTDFLIFSSSDLLFSRCINIGARALGDGGEAGSIKFIGELKQSLVMFYNEEINRKPARVLVCGAQCPEALIRSIESELQAPVMDLGGSGREEARDAAMASIEGISPDDQGMIDFILPEVQMRQALRKSTRDLIILGTAVTYALTLIFGFYWGRIYIQENYLHRLEQEALSRKKELGSLPEELKKIEFVTKNLAERQAPLYLLSQLEVVTPAGVAVKGFTLDEKKKVALRGQAESMADVFRLVDNLTKQGAFKDIQTRSTRQKKVNDKELTDFELNFQLE